MATIPTASQTDQEEMEQLQPAAPLIFSDSLDSSPNVFAWYRGEFAAANAIIDALCAHLRQLPASSNDYDPLLAAIQRRRLYWNPVIQSQKHHSIDDVTLELGRVAEKKTEFSGSKEMHQCFMSDNIFSKLEGCEERSSHKLTEGFKAKETVKGRMVNVVKGLKLYEDVFSESEICKLNDFVNGIHTAGQKGELSGQTFVLINKQLKGNKIEFIQLGVPIFEQINIQLGVPIFEQIKDDKSNIEPIPLLLHGVIDRLIQCKLDLDSEQRRPNGCIISFYEEGEFSQPFSKPPHLHPPLITLLLSESTMAFGHVLTSEDDGDYKGSLTLPLKKGSLLVMKGNSAYVARHVMCSSPNRRASISFFRVRPDSPTSTSSMTTAMTPRQPAIANPFALPNGTLSGYEAMDLMPKWGFLGAPIVLQTPTWPMALNPGKLRDGTGVFLPSPRQSRNVPLRQQGRLTELPSPIESHMEEIAFESHVEETASESSVTVKE